MCVLPTCHSRGWQVAAQGGVLHAPAERGAVQAAGLDGVSILLGCS
jgi:hypothetical protein